jgi:hypothetical protein
VAVFVDGMGKQTRQGRAPCHHQDLLQTFATLKLKNNDFEILE